jgi:hypothetical protein
MKTFDSVLDEITKLDYESTEILLEIIRKRQIEKRRNEISKNIRQSRQQFKKGQLKPLSVPEAIKTLRSGK